MEAEYIQDVFEKDEVDRIYLNFSDPWPKDCLLYTSDAADD